MTTMRGARIAALGFLLALGCSQGAEPNPFGPPVGPAPADGNDGPATFGVDTEGGVGGNCCVPRADVGCADEHVQSCVCMQAPACCTSGWGEQCVFLVDELGCGLCFGDPPEPTVGDPDGTGEPPPPPGGQDCCVPGNGPGCGDPVVRDCVCDEIPFCCASGWEEVCAAAVQALSCGHCDVPPPLDTGDVPPETGDPPVGGCCEIAGTPGCDDPGVEACVCMQDAYCCDTAWDDVCVNEVSSFGCGSCGGAMPPPGVSTCCTEQAGPGCDDPAIAACVCFIDEFCCATQWDAVCAIFVELFLCGSCS
jgi:hypothetical protein